MQNRPENSKQGRSAIIAGIDAGDHVERDLEELRLLLANLDVRVTGSVLQARRGPDPSSYIGSGKVSEIAQIMKEQGAELLVIDARLTPGQLANIKGVVSGDVWDRPLVIMKIFEKRAHTSEAKLQIELAKCRYEIPFLKGLGKQMSRPGGGLGTRGPGETEFERHRRKLERRVLSISRELETVRKRRRNHRERRKRAGFMSVALAGYTNSGKSTLLQTLSKDPGIVAEDRLFSTLDPTVRRVSLPTGKTVLVSDTVGFIRKLPPDLLAAFRATLEEVAAADLLLVVLDGSQKDYREDLAAVEDVLASIEAGSTPRIIVLNKTDLMNEAQIESACGKLQGEGNMVFPVSALKGDNLGNLLRNITVFMEESQHGEWEKC